MREAFALASPTVRQLSAKDPGGKQILSVVCKRTYHVDARGRLSRAPQQIPLFEDFVADPDLPMLLLHDTDLIAHKPLTDVLVLGHAYAPGPSTSVLTGVRIGALSKQVLALGDRRVTRSPTGQLLFSEPAPFERMPLGYDRAYGGIDGVTEARLGDPAAAVKACMPREAQGPGASEYSYPRNFVGKGYLIEPTPEAVEALALPNLEDPADRLTPERLAVGNTRAWPKMPLPASFGVFDYGWFPRLGYLGVVPLHNGVDAVFEEVRRGFAPASVLKETFLTDEPEVDFRFTCCGSLGLQLPYLSGDEEIGLYNLHPRQPKWEFRLPGERPVIATDGRGGKMNQTEPVIQTVTVEPDHDRVTVVWRGSARALRPYLPMELEKMPLRVEW
ncbi:DUF2169 family type VI secretion system accessory protein [Chondromyces apiculatus]|uniref:DUF2169 domain-containing protein n=1 Tax=Chondromyces apiculatus DSM 436 TaxID=1192034 RepID=A0A017TFM3_9BACT|nr:DUF2169 domain-containing protein [Chondromyces apiculatus]EYF08063.1 Hypothetical protein CAP_5823 [Chondromyces apiculatus DSM 436]